MINGIDPIHYSHHYINLGASKAVVSPELYKDEKDSYVSTQMRRAKEIRRYFEGAVIPASSKKTLEIDSLAEYSKQLFSIGQQNFFKTYTEPDNVTVLEFDARKKGFTKYTVIRVYERGVLKSKIEIAPQKNATIKNYKDGLDNYDYCQINFSNGKRIFMENAKEKNDELGLRLTADKVYTFKGSILKKYEEGYRFHRMKDLKATSVKKRFEPDFDDFIVKYSEDIVKDSPFKRERKEYENEAPFKRFYEG